MRLGQFLIGGKPMRIPGIVDVYQRRDQWFARSWPRPARQPDSADQLYWRERYRTSQAIVSSFRGAYLDAWRAIRCPPNKCWIDVARSCVLKRPDLFTNVNWPTAVRFRLYHDKDNFPYTNITSLLAGEYSDGSLWNFGAAPTMQYGSSWNSVLRWDDDGWLCPKGKRPKKKWKLSLISTPPNPADPPGSLTPYVIGSIPVEDRPMPGALYWMGRCPTGLTVVGLTEYAHPVTSLPEWCLWLPPIFCPNVEWP